MISTYLTYTADVSDLSKTLAQIAAQPDVSSSAQYYRDNIGKVTSVDDFLNNSRLFSYAMTAYGLQDMAYAKAFMRKVLTSDLTDSSSFVNKLTDPRFLTFAKAFQFTTDGKVDQQPVTAQDTTDVNDTIGLYSQQQVNQGTAAADEAAYYQANIGSVKTVDDLIGSQRLLNFALTSAGLDPSIMSNVTIKAVLTSDPSDPSSTINQLTNPGYKALAAEFSFASDGTAANGTAQSAIQTQDTVYQYYDATGTGTSPAGVAFKSQYYQYNIESVSSVDDLLANDKLLDVALTSVGLDPAVQSTVTLRQILTSDLSDPNSVANQQTNDAYRQLAAAFNFKTDGTTDGAAVQSDSALNAMVNQYSSGVSASVQSANDTESTFYKQAIGSVATVDDLLKNTRLYDDMLSAYGLDPNTVSSITIKQVLESDPTDPSSFVSQTHNAAYRKLAGAFNFDSDGNAKTASVAQTNSSLTSTIQAYDAQANDPTGQQTKTQDDNTYYGTTIAGIQTVDEFLNDKRLVSYALDAFGLQNDNLSNDQLRQILTSDPLDPKSFVNEPQNSKYRALAVAFNFDTEGKVLSTPATEAQDRSQIVATSDLYVRQTLETQAGDQDTGVQLALYFQRMAPKITSAYSILADKALLQVTETALNLPTSMSNADIDTQANMITKKLQITDLQDPDKLNKFLARFSALYDLKYSDAAASSPAVALLSGTGVSNGIVDITLSS